MDQLKIFFTTRTALTMIVVGILLAGLVGGVYLSQKQTQLKSRASACTIGQTCGSNCGAGGVGQCDECSGGWCSGGLCETCGSPSDLPTCKKTRICDQDVTGNSPSDCTLKCSGGQASYHCVQSDNKDCVADVGCSPDNNKCSQPPAPPPQPPGVGGPGTVCTPTDFGPKENLSQWCSCASRYAGASFKTDPQYSICSGGGPGTDAAVCNGPIFSQGGNPVTSSLIAGQTYDVKITMTNRDPNPKNPNPPIWQQGQYFLGFPTNGPPPDTGAGDFKTNADAVAKNNIWQVNWPDPKKLRLPLGSPVGPGGSAEFSFRVTPLQAGTHSFYWGMVHEGVNWFGGQCASDISVIDGQAGAPGAGGPPAVTTGDDVAGTCESKLLETKTLAVAKDIISGLQYKLQITMKNAGRSTWSIDTYILKPSTKTISDWGVSPIALRESLTGNSVAPGEAATFEFPVTGPVLKVADQPESRSFSFQMANGVSEFGGACQTGAITILPKTAALNATACFILSEDQSAVTKTTACNDPIAKALGIIHSYPSEPTQLDYKLIDTIAGVKTIYVRFISIRGEIADGFGQITFSPDPTVSSIACTQSSTGTGTIVALAGTNFGAHTQQGQGAVTVNRTQAQIVTWDTTNPSRNLIQATVPTRLEGTLDIDLKIDDGRTVTGGKCTIGTSSVQFTVNTQCTKPGSFSADNVDAIIIQNVAGAKPLVQTKISVSKGIPANFAPNLEASKSYSLVLRAPRTLVKKTDFTTDRGTINLGTIPLFLGDIAPFSAPDGAINSFDKAEMSRQWELSGGSSTAKTASLTEHETQGIVNSLDYSCLKLGIGKNNDVSLKDLVQ